MIKKSPEQSQAEDIYDALKEIVTFAHAGRRADARDSLIDLWPIISAGIVIDQDPGTVNIFSGVSLGFLRLKHQDVAREFAKKALIEAPSDLLAHAIAPVDDRIWLARQFIHHHQTQKAMDLLEVIQTTDADDESAFYIHLLRHYMSESENARALAPLDGRPTLLSLAVWGEAYIDKFLRTSLPSLLAPGNVPALAASDPVIFDIYTTEADRVRLAASPGIRALAEIARIDYAIVPAGLIDFKPTPTTADPDRFYYAGTSYVSAVKAKALGADLAVVGPEALYSDRYLSVSKAYLREGYKAVIMSPLRARNEDLATYLDAHDAVTSNAITLDAKHLLEYAIKHLNPLYQDMFIRSDSESIGQDVIAFYFKAATGFAGRSFQLCPALISHEIIPADLQFDGFTCDTRFLAECAQGKNPENIYKVIENPATELFVADLDSASDGTARVFGEFPVTVAQSVLSALKWCSRESDFSYFEWAIQKRFEFRCDPAILPYSDLAEAETVTSFLSLFKVSQAEHTNIIDSYRYA